MQVCVCEKELVTVCVREFVTERKRKKVCMCACVREFVTERECGCVCACVREGDRERVMIKKLTERTHFLLFNPKSQQLIYFGWTHKSGNKRGLCVLLSDQNRFLLKIHQLGINPTPPFVTRRRHRGNNISHWKIFGTFQERTSKKSLGNIYQSQFYCAQPERSVLSFVLKRNEMKTKISSH